MKRPVDTASTAALGRKLVAGEVVNRGGRCVEEHTALNRRVITCRTSRGDHLTIIVKSKSSGTWQATIADGDVDRAEANTFWVFVDVEDPGKAVFMIAPDVWVRENIREHHAAYLERHGNKRAISPDSEHHAVQVERLLEWRDRWDILNLRAG